MGTHRSPALQRDAERLALEAAARRRQLTDAEDQRLAELAFRGDRRGTRLLFSAPRHRAQS